MTGEQRWQGRVLAAALLLAACERGQSSEAPVDAAAGAQVVAGEPAAADAQAAEASGLASAVKQEVEAARSASAGPDAAAPKVPAGAPLVAVVDGVPLPRSAFDEIYALKVGKYTERGRTIPPTADRRYRVSIVERLVHHERLRRRVTELGVDFDPTRLDERELQARRGIEDWPAHLRRRGETEASLRAMVIAELREALILEQTGALAVSRAEIEAEYGAIKGEHVSTKPRFGASHILVRPAEAGPGDDPAALEAAAKAEAQRIHALATAPGADFAALARTRSVDPSGPIGGELGIFTLDRMVEPFSAAVSRMKVGETSRPVKTKFGFHIIRLTGKWPPGELPIEALEDQIVERLRGRKLHAGRRELKTQLEAAYPVTHHLLTPQELESPSRTKARGPSVVVDRSDVEPDPR